MKPRLTYEPVRDGEWVQPADRRGHRLACCDCGLVHIMSYRIRRGCLQFRAFRDAPATRAHRRQMVLAAKKIHPARRK